MQCTRCGMRVDSGEKCPRCGFSLGHVYQHPDVDLICKNKKRKIRRIIALAAAAFILWDAAAIGMVLYGGESKSERLYRKQQETLQQLEAVYQDGDYAKLDQMLDDMDPDSSVYDKYETMNNLHRNLQDAQVGVERYIQEVKNQDPYAYLSEYDVMELFRVIARCDRIGENDYLLAEQDRVLEIRQQTQSLMQDQLGLTEEQIQKGAELADEDGLALDDYCLEIVELVRKEIGNEM